MVPRQQIADFLKAFDWINAAYLHGSVVKGGFRDDSDVDIALLPFMDSRVKPDELFEMSGKLGFLARRTVDSALLGTSNLILAKEVAAFGESLFVKDRVAADLFFMTALGEYLQLKHERKCVEAAYAG